LGKDLKLGRDWIWPKKGKVLEGRFKKNCGQKREGSQNFIPSQRKEGVGRNLNQARKGFFKLIP